MQRTWLGKFLEVEEYAVPMLIDARAKPAEYSALPTFETGDWLDMFSQAVENLTQAIEHSLGPRSVPSACLNIFTLS